MPFADNNGKEIYYETVGNPRNPPLVMLHGFLNSLNIWNNTGYTRDLQDDYFLILIDSRGYGKSFKSHKPDDYFLTHRVADVNVVLDALRIYKANIMGYSMGGRIAFAFAKYWPERINTLIIGGMSPYKMEKSVIDLDQRLDTLRDGMDATIANYEESYGKLPTEIRDEILANDHQALMADTNDTKEWAGIEEILPYIRDPVLYYVGDGDYFLEGAFKAANMIPNVKFVVLKGANHQSAYVRKAHIMPHLKEFLQEFGNLS